MGAGRAGWYSYDRLDNGGVASADHIVGRLQHVSVGDLFPGLPGERDAFFLLRFEPPRFLVLGAPGGAPLVTWVFLLEATAATTTRLIVRARARDGYRLWRLPKPLTIVVARMVHFIMQRKQLHGIAARAEAHAH